MLEEFTSTIETYRALKRGYDKLQHDLNTKSPLDVPFFEEWKRGIEEVAPSMRIVELRDRTLRFYEEMIAIINRNYLKMYKPKITKEMLNGASSLESVFDGKEVPRELLFG